MLMDIKSTLADKQVVTATAQGDTPIDLVTGRNLGAGEPLFLNIYANEAAAAAGAATVDFALITGTSLDGNQDINSPTTVASTGAIAKADLTVKRVASIAIPADVVFDRYLNVLMTVATGPLTAGKFTAVIEPSVSNVRAAPAEQ